MTHQTPSYVSTLPESEQLQVKQALDSHLEIMPAYMERIGYINKEIGAPMDKTLSYFSNGAYAIGYGEALYPDDPIMQLITAEESITQYKVTPVFQAVLDYYVAQITTWDDTTATLIMQLWIESFAFGYSCGRFNKVCSS